MKTPNYSIFKQLFSLIFSLIYISVSAQIGISPTGIAPHNSAALDINNNAKGLLIPRVSLTSINDATTVPNPAISLLVFNINPALPDGVGYYGWNGDTWTLIKAMASNIAQPGSYRMYIPVDGDQREFWVHVPVGYNPTTSLPMLIMLHGTSGDGQKFLLNSGWAQLGDEEDIITVFPSSWRYKIIKPDTTISITTKWNTVPDCEWRFFPGQVPRNDIKFLKLMIAAIVQKLNVDTHRIYLEGFSNGGQMAAKCSIEMSDILAAVACNAGYFVKDTTYTPKRLAPVLFSIGNEDYGPGVFGPAIPMGDFAATLAADNPLRPAHANYLMSQKTIQYFGLNAAHGPIMGDSTRFLYTDYTGLSGQANNVYRHYFVKGLAHKYPNENNFNGYDAPREHWAWMRQFTLP